MWLSETSFSSLCLATDPPWIPSPYLVSSKYTKTPSRLRQAFFWRITTPCPTGWRGVSHVDVLWSKTSIKQHRAKLAFGWFPYWCAATIMLFRKSTPVYKEIQHTESTAQASTNSICSCSTLKFISWSLQRQPKIQPKGLEHLLPELRLSLLHTAQHQVTWRTIGQLIQASTNANHCEDVEVPWARNKGSQQKKLLLGCELECLELPVFFN